MLDGNTTQRKSNLVRQALLDDWRTQSDREMASLLGVSNRTVSVQRKRLEQEGQILPRVESTHAVLALLVRRVYFSRRTGAAQRHAL